MIIDTVFRVKHLTNVGTKGRAGSWENMASSMDLVSLKWTVQQ